LLPDMLVFREMQALLGHISRIMEDDKLASEGRESAIKVKCMEFLDKVNADDPARGRLATRIRNEIYETLQMEEKYHLEPKS
jgi:hypothetical protein